MLSHAISPPKASYDPNQRNQQFSGPLKSDLGAKVNKSFVFPSLAVPTRVDPAPCQPLREFVPRFAGMRVLIVDTGRFELGTTAICTNSDGPGEEPGVGIVGLMGVDAGVLPGVDPKRGPQANLCKKLLSVGALDS